MGTRLLHSIQFTHLNGRSPIRFFQNKVMVEALVPV
jgi:hypothetical protein